MCDAQISEASCGVTPASSVEVLLQQVIGLRLRLLEHLCSCASGAVPIIAPVFNIPKLPLDYYGLLTAHSGVSFLRGTIPTRLGDGSLGVTELPKRRSYSSSKMVLQVGPSDLPIEMSAYLFLRPLLTNLTSSTLWRNIIEKLGYSGREQPSLKLDRGQAATAKVLAHTLWYQATVQLLSAAASPCKLRARPGERPFLVVFRGEGATDFGGPFQEFLSGVANEVMGPLAESPDELLPTFLACLPSFNSTHAIGPHQDSVVLRPDPSAPLPDPLVSVSDLLPPALPDTSGGNNGSPSCAEVSPDPVTQEPAQSVGSQPDRSSHAEFGEDQQSIRSNLSNAHSSPPQGRLRRQLHIDTLWTSDTILGALPSPARRVLPRGHRAEDGGLPDRIPQEDPFQAAVSRREEMQAAPTPLNANGTLSRVEEDTVTEETMYILMYEALGRLMAMCFCIGSAFNVTLNPLLWKKLVAAPLTIDVSYRVYRLANKSVAHRFVK